MLDNEIGTVIENQAYIFFDYNQPILTPLAYSTIWEEPEPLFNVFVSDFLGEKSQVKAYPNPANEHFFLDFSEIKQHIETAEIEIYDVFGRLVLAQKINENLNKVEISSLENGVYVYKIVGKSSVLGSGKIMVQGL